MPGPAKEAHETTFTVFTPTYNRADTLGRVRDSLEAQTFRDFEWLIVDDGSTDGTGQLVERWRRTTRFPIRYLYQSNAGKHVAFNRAVREAKGALFLTLDSDDACVPEALERLLYWWEQIPQDERAGFSAVTALCQDQTGRLVGTRFPESPFDGTSIELRWRHRVRGEKWGFQLTEVLRSHPFPEPAGARYVSESYVWRAIDASGYKTRFVNEVLRIYWIDDNDTANMSTLSLSVMQGRMVVHAQTLDDLGAWFRVNPRAFASAAVNLSRYGLQRGMRWPTILGTVRRPWAKVLVAALLPVGAIVSLRDRRHRRRRGDA